MNLTPKEALNDAEAVILGIGSEFGIDVKRVIAENNVYQEYLRFKTSQDAKDDIVEKYIINSIYFHEVKSGKNEIVLKHIDTYNKLFNGIKGREYFVVTTCTDDIIYYSDFDRKKITAPCGSISRLQCSCHMEEGKGIADCSDILNQIYQSLNDMGDNIEIDRIKNIIPECSECGKELTFNVRVDENYNENGYIEQWNQYTKWLQRTLNRQLVLLELGVDFSVPTVIRWPFEKIAMINYKASLYRINKKLPQLPEEMKDKGFSINDNSFDYINNNF